MAMKFKDGKYNTAQKKWCEMYERETGFEPLMCDYEAGNEDFYVAAKKSNRWFADWSSDALLRITRDYPPGTPDTLITRGKKTVFTKSEIENAGRRAMATMTPNASFSREPERSGGESAGSES